MLDVERLPDMYVNWRQRWAARDERHMIIDAVIAGDFNEVDPDEEEVKSRSPNMVQVALEDTAEAAALVPTVRIQPTKKTQKAKDAARLMENVAASYYDVNDIDLKIPKAVMDMGAYGLHVWTVEPDLADKVVKIDRRDPRFCYPEPGYRPGDSVRRCLFARTVYLTSLPMAYQRALMEDKSESTDNSWYENQQVVLVEYHDKDEYVLAGLIGDGTRYTTEGEEVLYVPVLLERIESKTGVCPVVIGQRITIDDEPRGQFDQVVDILLAHIQLQGITMDYADQSVYSDIWVRDLIGEMPYGGGAYIELGPNGAIGRVPPAVSSLNIQQDDSFHVGARWPKGRPGEIDQSQASAKFLEASAGMMNTAIRTYHQILQRDLEKAIRIALEIDKRFFAGQKRTASGVLQNQMFLEEYDAGNIDLSAKIRIDYGLGFGKDPSSSAVLHIQYAQNEYVSHETVMENIDGLSDIGLEKIRLDTQKFRAIAMAKILQGIQDGTIPDKVLKQLNDDREKGEDLFEIFEKYVVDPQEELAGQMLPQGLPGAQPALGGGPAPPPPGPGGAPGPGIPPPPGGNQLMSRLNVPAGEGGTLGAQVMGGV